LLNNTDNKKPLTRQWLEESDSSDSDTGRKVVSAKDKAWERFQGRVKDIRQGMGVSNVYSSFGVSDFGALLCSFVFCPCTLVKPFS